MNQSRINWDARRFNYRKPVECAWWCQSPRFQHKHCVRRTKDDWENWFSWTWRCSSFFGSEIGSNILLNEISQAKLTASIYIVFQRRKNVGRNKEIATTISQAISLLLSGIFNCQTIWTVVRFLTHLIQHLFHACYSPFNRNSTETQLSVKFLSIFVKWQFYFISR